MNESENKSTEKEISLEGWRKLSKGNEQLFLFVRDVDAFGSELESYKDFGSPSSLSNSKLKGGLLRILIVAIVLALTYFSIYKLSTYAKPSSVNFAQLSDSSEVQLFGSSKLSLDRGFDSTNRNLSLVGKAFFDVEHNDELPFIINTKNGRITVKGTSFLVEELGHKLKIVVREGTVEFENSNYKKLLKKNEAFIFLNDDFEEVSNFNFSDLLVTRSYQEVSVNKIIDQLQFDYNVAIDYSSAARISNCIFNGHFENASVFDILSELAIVFDLEYFIENGIIHILKIDCTN